LDLFASQIEFGVAYAREARDAYHHGELTYGEVAQRIAMNSYAAALRFAGNLRTNLSPDLLARIEALELDLVEMLQASKSNFRSIA
jgi:hypothetical protein